MKRTPFDLSFDELAAAGKRATEAALQQAQARGVKVARLEHITPAAPTGAPVGLPGRSAPQPARTILKAQRPAGAATPQQPVYVREESPGSATVLTLGAHMCKWPIGDPSSDSFTFCGRRTGEGDGPYCQDHQKEADGGNASVGASRKKASAADLARSIRRFI